MQPPGSPPTILGHEGVDIVEAIEAYEAFDARASG
jgi:Zn-dependent alcohol dehydrogenase